MYTKFTVLLAIVAVPHCASNHLKTVVVDKEVPAAGNAIAGGSLGASASWGGYSAGAGLGGGSSGNGGLFAGASAPQGSANAGIGGGTVGAGGGLNLGGDLSGGGAGVGGGGFFDKIFSIPISVLQSVNTHLNNKEFQEGPGRPLRRGGHRRRNHFRHDYPEEGKTVSVQADGNVGATAGGQGGVGFKSATGTADASAGAANAGATAGGTVTVRKNYDTAFAIPIAALKSVNQFLNGK